eukprot:5878721-Prymnesium_polylepis.1
MGDDGDDRTKKLALAIRSATESDDFDLAGYSAEACDALAQNAFAKPLPLKEMVRLSFTVGGGKKVRQKYNDGLPALLSDALKKIGFNEDRGASLSNDCGARRGIPEGAFAHRHPASVAAPHAPMLRAACLPLPAAAAGLFKYQHNTDTDLKVVHVFPRIDPAAGARALHLRARFTWTARARSHPAAGERPPQCTRVRGPQRVQSTVCNCLTFAIA